jgi:hypothetical protein
MPAANDDDDPHGRLIGILTEALQKAGAEGITKQDVIPAVSDFLTSDLVLSLGPVVNYCKPTTNASRNSANA